MLYIEHLTKTFGEKKAVDDLSLHIAPGEIYGFIGHNGAGKTTTLKSVVGIQQFDSGRITIGGHSIQDDPIACKKMLAYIPDNPDLYEFMTGIQYLNFIADIFGVEESARQERIRKYADLFELTTDLAQPVAAYSHGMKQKLAIISAWLHEPKLILMDEPFVGLDPKASHILKGMMREVCDAGGAIFFSTHVLEVAEKLCDKVAIIKQLDHASLDEIANAVAAELDKIAADNNVTIEYDITSGQNDQTILKQLSDQAIADQVDAIIPIATTAAQISALSAEDTKTPVVYAAVSDPEAASLTGIDYVTGTSDALNTSFIMDMMFAQNPDVAKVGLLYSLSEPNSTKPIADAKAYLDAKGIEYVEQTANTNDEVVAAASALIADGVDAVFTPTDNVIMAAELAIYEDLAKAGIPHYTGADSFVRNGAYSTCGVNYTDLGAKTADLAYSAITDGMDAMEDYYLMDGGIITVNTDTASAMSLDYSCFDSMGTVVEVTTTKD
jgi:putative ABC transport system substrate-binding protein